MARKTQRSFGAELNQKKREDEVHENEDALKDAKGPIAPEGVNAPLWRRVCAYVIDLVLALFALFLFTSQLQLPDLPTTQRIIFLISNFMVQIWLFGMIPTTGWAGQTLGRKIFKLYTRDVATLEYIPMWKSILRDFGFGVFAVIFTVPMEIIYIVIQLVLKNEPAKNPKQAFTLFGKEIILARDSLFKTETVYLAKK